MINSKGEEVFKAQRPVECLFPEPGWVEADPMKIWVSVIDVVNEVLVVSSSTMEDIAGIGGELFRVECTDVRAQFRGVEADWERGRLKRVVEAALAVLLLKVDREHESWLAAQEIVEDAA